MSSLPWATVTQGLISAEVQDKGLDSRVSYNIVIEHMPTTSILSTVQESLQRSHMTILDAEIQITVKGISIHGPI